MSCPRPLIQIEFAPHPCDLCEKQAVAFIFKDAGRMESYCVDHAPPLPKFNFKPKGETP